MSTFNNTGVCCRARLGLILAVGAAAAFVAGCDNSTTPPPGGGGAAPAPAGNAAPVSTQPGATGPLGNMRDNPTSLLGRSAQSGKQVAGDIQSADAVAMGMAQELTGEAVAVEVAGLKWSVPGEWVRNPSPGPMRNAEFRIPDPEGEEGAPGATAVWFHFPGGQGGTVEQNIARWATMVHDAGGQPAEPDMRHRTVNGVKVTTVTLEGTYQDGPPGGVPVPRPNYILRGAIFEGPQGLIFLRTVGPRGVMNAVFPQWERLVNSTRRNTM